MNDIARAVRSISEELKTDLVGFLAEIIAIKSLSGKESAVVDRIKIEMERLGYDAVRVDPFGNLIGRIGRGKRIIALDGHCDTVDTGRLDAWDLDPFSGEILNGAIHGRGACDQKGGLASAIYAGAAVKRIGIPNDASLVVVASVQEEDFEGESWKYILEQGEIAPEAVVLTEPTDLKIAVGQRGRMEIEVTTKGSSCHGSAPERGDNAVYKIAPIVGEIEALNARMKSDPLLGKGSVVVTRISSTSPSSCAVPDSSAILLDRRLTKGETEDKCLEEIRSLPHVRSSQAEVKTVSYTVKGRDQVIRPVKAFLPPWIMEESDPLIENAKTAHRSLFQSEPELCVWAFSTNGVATKGLFNIPTIGIGPSKEQYAHAANERVEIRDIVKAMELYALTALNWASERQL